MENQATTMSQRDKVREDFYMQTIQCDDSYNARIDNENSRYRQAQADMRRRWAEQKERAKREQEEENIRHNETCAYLRREWKRERARIENARQSAFARLKCENENTVAAGRTNETEP